METIENLFVWEGKKGDEVDFLYVGDLARTELYSQNPIHVVEETYEFDAEWVPVDDISTGNTPLYPATDYKALFSNLGTC